MASMDKGLPMAKDSEGRIQPKKKSIGVQKHDDKACTDLKSSGLGRLSGIASAGSKCGNMGHDPSDKGKGGLGSKGKNSY